ncbi:unnamed protein product, partial [marine sediment metagenome]
KWITESELLSRSACDLCTIVITAAKDHATINVYDGENTNGDLVAKLECLANRSQEFKPFAPIYCRRGLYIELVEKYRGVLAQWRLRSSKEG